MHSLQRERENTKEKKKKHRKERKNQRPAVLQREREQALSYLGKEGTQSEKWHKKGADRDRAEKKI